VRGYKEEGTITTAKHGENLPEIRNWKQMALLQ
jgi:hypothetical protein